MRRRSSGRFRTSSRHSSRSTRASIRLCRKRRRSTRTVPRTDACSARRWPADYFGQHEVLGSDIDDLRGRSLAHSGARISTPTISCRAFTMRAAARAHEAIDILAPRGTDVLAVEDGTVAKLFTSEAGGLTVYQFDPVREVRLLLRASRPLCAGLKEGAGGAEGRCAGRVGTTGNAPKNTPHLHFAISKLDPDKRWWGGTALDPFLVWRDPSDEN